MKKINLESNQLEYKSELMEVKQCTIKIVFYHFCISAL